MKVKTPPDIIVIGAGASGLVAAIMAAREGAKVEIMEREDKPGKKLLVTGNGRCNLTHIDPVLWTRYHSDSPVDPDSFFALMQRYDPACCLQFFRELGLLTHEKDGYVYPRSDQAQSVLQLLTRECTRLGVRIRTNTAITGIEKQPDGSFLLRTPTWQYPCRKVILSCGSAAMTGVETEGNGYNLLQDLGIQLVPPVPALTGLISRDSLLGTAAGSRTQSAVYLDIDGQKKGDTEYGQIQWAKDGLSGICVMQLSRYVSRALSAPGRSGRKTDLPKITLHIDFLPELSAEELKEFLLSPHMDNSTDLTEENLIQQLSGMLPDRIVRMLLKKQGRLSGDRQAIYARLLSLIKDFSVSITDVRGFTQAQVCAGGASLEEIDPSTLEVRRLPGLYLCGEILDIDGPCGGYNLQWAWSSAMAAGLSAGRIDFPVE